MKVEKEIKAYIDSLPNIVAKEIEQLHQLILNILPECMLWYLDGKNSEGKQVTNPDIGYGFQYLKYKDGSSKEFYQVGLSAVKTGISIYIIGLSDKKYLINTYQNTIGKAKVSGYCINFKKIEDIHLEVLSTVIKAGYQLTLIKK